MGRDPPRIRVRCPVETKEQFDVLVAKHDGDTQAEAISDMMDFIDERETEWRRFCSRDPRRG